MSDYTLTIPDEIVFRAQQVAQQTSQTVDQVLLDYLQAFSHKVAPLGRGSHVVSTAVEEAFSGFSRTRH